MLVFSLDLKMNLFAKIKCTYNKEMYTYLKETIECLVSWVCDTMGGVSCTLDVSLTFSPRFDHEIFNSSNLLCQLK